MQKIIKEINEEKGIVQITLPDERWYWKSVIDKTIPKATEVFVPSVTWITSFYPKGVAYFKWLANLGWNEAEAAKQAAADKGSKVHKAIVDLIDGKDIPMDAKYVNPSTEQPEELTVEEWEALMSFRDWFVLTKPQVLARESVVFSDEYGYAGTIDIFCKIEGETWLIDFKTGQYIWPSSELQVSAYKHAFEKPIDKLGILQLGYRRNKNLFKLTEVEDQFSLFLAAKQIWAKETTGDAPVQKDLPLILSLKVEEKDEKVESKKLITKKKSI